MPQGPKQVVRSHRLRARIAPEDDARLEACRHVQRAVYNLTVASVERCGGPVPVAADSRGQVSRE